MRPLLSVIIPFGASQERAYIEERVRERAETFADFFAGDGRIEFIFVEGYSSKKHELENEIKKYGHRYLKDEQDNFSQGRCRNAGAAAAQAGVLLFLDLDSYLSRANFKKILRLIQVKKIEENPCELVILPVIILKDEAGPVLAGMDEDLWDAFLECDLLSGVNKYNNFFAPSSTSHIVINKQKFLELGGYDPAFVGHSYEDFDLLARILNDCVDFEKMPANLFYDARGWDFKSFEGFRAWFSLLGYEACFHGIYAYHFAHPEPNQDGYFDNKHKNRRLFYKNLALLKKTQRPKNKKIKRDLRSFAYKPYFFELKSRSFFSFFKKIFGLDLLKAKLSHLRIFNFFRARWRRVFK